MPPPSPHPRIRDGFPGQRMIVLPRPIVRRQLHSPQSSGTIPTDVGYFPEATFHEVSRPEGSPQLILIICTRGHGWALINNRRYEVPPGHALIIPPNVPHSYGAAEPRAWTIYWIHIAGRQLPSILPLLASKETGALLPIGDESELFSLIEEIHQTLLHSYGHEQLLLASLATGRILSRLITLRRNHPESADTRARIDRTISHVTHRLAAPIHIPELARLANLSPSHFAATFKRHTGHPVLDYFIRLRMQRAAHLLDTTPLPIKSIAAELGYDDPLYFSRLFRKVHDLSPAQYRSIKKG